MLGRIAGAVRFKEPLSFHTSLRIGGPAEFFIMPRDLDDLCYAMAFAEQEDLPVIVLGGGNNVLASDRGVQAVVLKLQGVFSRAQFQGSEAAVGAGMSLSGLIRDAAAQDLGGLECLAGIPASVGGALAANAGTREGSIIDFCSAVYFVHPDGTLGEFRPLAGAGQAFDLPPGSILVGCRIQLVRRPAATIHKDIQQRVKQRHSAKPLAMATAGYIWKDPPAGSAARLVEAAGLRGKRVNGAEVCTKSGNLIVNRGGACHKDVLGLMEMTQERVAMQFGVTLRPEIRMLGFPAPVALEAGPLEPAAAR